MSAHESRNIIIVTPNDIRSIPSNHNLMWLPLFYALPEELVEKRAIYLSIPRNIHQLMESSEHMALIESDAFLELVWDCYAWAVWQFIQVPKSDGTYQSIPGTWDNYSGDFPLWRWAYEIVAHIRLKFENELELGMRRLIRMKKWEAVPMLSYRHFGNLVGNLTDMIVAEQNWQPMFDEIWTHRQIEDYDGSSNYKRDFMRSWTHSRAGEHISIEEVMENGVKLDGDTLFEIEDPRGQFEEKVVGEVQMEQFKSGLTERDKTILQMRFEGYSLQEIADKVGFKTASAVSKRIEKIAGNLEKFLGDEYKTFSNKYTR